MKESAFVSDLIGSRSLGDIRPVTDEANMRPRDERNAPIKTTMVRDEDTMPLPDPIIDDPGGQHVQITTTENNGSPQNSTIQQQNRQNMFGLSPQQWNMLTLAAAAGISITVIYFIFKKDE